MSQFIKAIDFSEATHEELEALQVGQWVYWSEALKHRKGIWCGFERDTNTPCVWWKSHEPVELLAEYYAKCKPLALSKFELYQNTGMSQSNGELINRFGLDVMFERDPAIKSAWDARHKGSKSFKANTFKHWAKVSDIQATDLEDCFYQQNNPYGLEECEARLTRYARQWSMSVGDIVFDGASYHMCDNAGWTAIQVSAQLFWG